jgi:RimJ/RimL family protein N-acetyltransferase
MAKKKSPKRRPVRRSSVDVNSPPRQRLDPVDPSQVRLKPGKGSAGRGGAAGEFYWHIYVGETRVGYVYINLLNEDPFGKHASIQIHINKRHQARGIGSVAYKLACVESDLDEIYAKMRKANIGSRKAAERAGFVIVTDLDVSQYAMKWRKDHSHSS